MLIKKNYTLITIIIQKNRTINSDNYYLSLLIFVLCILKKYFLNNFFKKSIILLHLISQ